MSGRRGLTGVQEVLNNINAAVHGISIEGQRALIEVGVAIRREGQKQTPVEFGNLANSWYGPTLISQPNGVVAEIGLTATYAPYVHENVGANFTGPRPGAQSPTRRGGGKPTAKAKFLEDPLKEHEGEVIRRLLSFTSRVIR
jgi:hypothetical protein